MFPLLLGNSGLLLFPLLFGTSELLLFPLLLGISEMLLFPLLLGTSGILLFPLLLVYQTSRAKGSQPAKKNRRHVKKKVWMLCMDVMYIKMCVVYRVL